MNENQKIIEELNALDITVNATVYSEIRDCYHFKLHNALDPVRLEICKCLIFNLSQAAITLTSHLLEKFLKMELIDSEMDGITMTTPIQYEKRYKELLEKFDGLDLHDTINRSCSKGIIKKEQKKKLQIYREKFRNAYGHATATEIFKGKTFFGAVGSFTNTKAIEPREFNVSTTPAVQGFVQEQLAREAAPEYFLYIDKVITDRNLHKHPDLPRQQF